MKFIKWLFRKKQNPDYADFITFSPIPLSQWDIKQMQQAVNVKPSPQQYLEARNISPDEHIKYMKAIADQLVNVGVLEEGMPNDWYSDDGNGRVDA